LPWFCDDAGPINRVCSYDFRLLLSSKGHRSKFLRLAGEAQPDLTKELLSCLGQQAHQDGRKPKHVKIELEPADVGTVNGSGRSGPSSSGQKTLDQQMEDMFKKQEAEKRMSRRRPSMEEIREVIQEPEEEIVPIMR